MNIPFKSLSAMLQKRPKLDPGMPAQNLVSATPQVPHPLSPLTPEAAQAGGGADDHPFVKLRKLLKI